MSSIRIALASPPIAASLDEGMSCMAVMIAQAAAQGARLVCFPEAYLPGLRGQDFPVPSFSAADEARALAAVAALARAHGIAVVAGHEHVTPAGSRIAATVFDASGELVGSQLKTQLDPSEERDYRPGNGRRLFDVAGLRFGIAICHEGWRYPETVRWAAARGATLVLHPQLTGSDRQGPQLTTWGDRTHPYYERAMEMRSRENTIWFASVNYGVRYQESATAVVDPDGALHAQLPYGAPGVLVTEIDLSRATGLLARRFAPERYGDTHDTGR